MRGVSRHGVGVADGGSEGGARVGSAAAIGVGRLRSIGKQVGGGIETCDAGREVIGVGVAAGGGVEEVVCGVGGKKCEMGR